MKVNQIGITIYDNKPTLPANRWYEVTTDKEEASNRYKMEMNFLHKGYPIKLRGALVWKPSQLRRLSYWEANSDFYEGIVSRVKTINEEIRSGRIAAHIPALITIPNMNESFKTADNKRHFKWVMPQMPSAIIASRQMLSPTFYQWRIQWISSQFEHEFILDDKTEATEVPGRKRPATRVYKGFAGPHTIDDRLITADYATPTYIVQTKMDDAYEEFKTRINFLYSLKTDSAEEEALRVMNQFQEYTNRMLAEIE
jgi:hypothetical protein